MAFPFYFSSNRPFFARFGTYTRTSGGRRHNHRHNISVCPALFISLSALQHLALCLSASVVSGCIWLPACLSASLCLDARDSALSPGYPGDTSDCRREQLAQIPFLHSSGAGWIASHGSRPARSWSATRTANVWRSATTYGGTTSLSLVSHRAVRPSPTPSDVECAAL